MNTRLQKIERLCKRYRVKAMYLFGSRGAEIFQAVQDDSPEIQRSDSDLDIGVLTHTTLSVDEKVNLTLALEKILSVPRVDLVVLQEADAFLAANIIRGERIYVEDSYLADEYELFVLRRAGDLAELERERISMILQVN
jgi:uncharacterized protein